MNYFIFKTGDIVRTFSVQNPTYELISRFFCSQTRLKKWKVINRLTLDQGEKYEHELIVVERKSNP